MGDFTLTFSGTFLDDIINGITGAGNVTTPKDKLWVRAMFGTDTNLDPMSDDPIDNSKEIVASSTLNLAGGPVIPEASTIAIWSILGVIGLAYGGRRRK